MSLARIKHLLAKSKEKKTEANIKIVHAYQLPNTLLEGQEPNPIQTPAPIKEKSTVVEEKKMDPVVEAMLINETDLTYFHVDDSDDEDQVRKGSSALIYKAS